MTRSPANAEPEPMRIVLVGRTGLDASLRRDRSVVLQRARTYLDAIGEVGQPIDEEAGDAPLAVLVGANAVPSDELASFAAAVRSLKPDAALLTIGDPRDGSNGPFDGSVSRAADADEVRRAAQRRSDRRAPGELPAPRAHAARACRRCRKRLHRRRAGADPLDSLLRGEDVLPAAIAAARRELNDDRIDFIRADAGGPMPKLLADRAFAEVRRRGHLFGWLVGPSDSLRSMSLWTARLALWLAAEAQMRQLRHVAFTDATTGAKNAAYFSRALGTAIERARPGRCPVGVVVARVTYADGSPSVLSRGPREAAAVAAFQRLQRRAAPHASISRLGDLEFAIVLEGEERAESAFSSILARAGGASSPTENSPHRLSLGWSEYPWDGGDSDALLAGAELRLGAAGRSIAL